MGLPHNLVDEALLETMARDVRKWGEVETDDAVEIGRMAAAVTEPPLAKRQALLTGGGSASANGTNGAGLLASTGALLGTANAEPGLKQFQTVVVLSIETLAGAKLISKLETAQPSDLGTACFKGCAPVLLDLFASIANRREHGGVNRKNWMRAAHAELPVRRIQVRRTRGLPVYARLHGLRSRGG